MFLIDLRTHLPTYVLTYIHTYIHTCIHTYICICMHAHMHACILAFTHMHAYLHTVRGSFKKWVIVPECDSDFLNRPSTWEISRVWRESPMHFSNDLILCCAVVLFTTLTYMCMCTYMCMYMVDWFMNIYRQYIPVEFRTHQDTSAQAGTHEDTHTDTHTL